MDSALAAWKRLTGQLEARGGNVQEILFRLYSHPSRRYHNLSHITDCLTELEEFKSMHPSYVSSLDIDEITIAVWFHDAIYDPRAPSNEEDSAHLFEQVSEGMDLSSRESIKRMILATKHHHPLSCSSSMLQEQLVLDLDLSILGQSKSKFDEYDEAIRMEYDWVPEAVYRKKRADVLRGFLQRNRVYFTDYFHEKFDSNARHNLERAIASLMATPSAMQSA